MFSEDILSETGRADFLEALKPRPGEAPRWPTASAIKRGEAGEFPRVGDDLRAIVSRGQDCYHGLRPTNGWQGWLMDQVAVTTLGIDRCGRSERRSRDRSAIRAGVNWDEDRMLAAEVLGKRIAEVPQVALGDLRGTPHGCDWLIRRWALLGQAAEVKKAWTLAQLALAHDLLGTPAEGRDGEPGRTFEGEDGLTPVVPDRVELARREIAKLRARKAEVMHLDALDRAMAEADLVVDNTRDIRKLGRHEAMLRSWLRWLVKQIQLAPPDRSSPAEYYPELPETKPEEAPQARPAPEAAPQPPAPVAEVADEAEAEPEPEEEQAPLPRIAGSTRKDPKVGRDLARREARRRKREHRRA